MVLAHMALPWSAAAADAVRVDWGQRAVLARDGAGWGRMTQLQDGRWLAVNTRFGVAKEGTPLELRISEDRARTWTLRGQVAEAGRRLDNGELLQLPDGRILLAMRSLIEHRSYRLVLYASGDQGLHWQSLSVIARNEEPQGRTDRGVWEPKLYLLPDGRLTVLYADEALAGATPAYAQVVAQRISEDGGRSWGDRRVVVAEPGGGHLRPGMPVMTRLIDGRWLMAFEICGRDPQCPVSMKYSDDGVHWDAGLGMPMGGLRCAPSVLALEGTLLATSCANRIEASQDAGAKWRPLPSAPGPIGFRHSWPALYDLGDGEIAQLSNVGRNVELRFGRLRVAP